MGDTDDVAHPAFRSSLLLRNAALPVAVRIGALSLCDNQYEREALAGAHRQSVGDKELAPMDSQAGRNALQRTTAGIADIGKQYTEIPGLPVACWRA